MPQMRMIVDGHATNIYPDLALDEWFEGLFIACESVVNDKDHGYLH